MQATWSYPIPLRLGPGRAADSALACRDAGVSAPLVISEPGMEAFVAPALTSLEQAGMRAAAFAASGATPTEREIGVALGAFVIGAHDGVMVVGGDATVDLGKLILLMDGRSEPVRDFAASPRDVKISAERAAPLIVMTGLVGRAAGATIELSGGNGACRRFQAPGLTPRAMIIETDILANLAPQTIAAAGFGAISDAVETLIAPHYQPFAHGIAVEALRLTMANVVTAYWNPGDADPHCDLASGIAMAGLISSPTTGLIDAAAHVIAARLGREVGVVKAVLVARALRLWRDGVEDKLGAVAAYLGVSGGLDGLQTALGDLAAEMSMPHQFSTIGVTAGDLPAIISDVRRDAPETDIAKLRELLKGSL